MNEMMGLDKQQMNLNERQVGTQISSKWLQYGSSTTWLQYGSSSTWLQYGSSATNTQYVTTSNNEQITTSHALHNLQMSFPKPLSMVRAPKMPSMYNSKNNIFSTFGGHRPQLQTSRNTNHFIQRNLYFATSKTVKDQIGKATNRRFQDYQVKPKAIVFKRGKNTSEEDKFVVSTLGGIYNTTSSGLGNLRNLNSLFSSAENNSVNTYSTVTHGSQQEGSTSYFINSSYSFLFNKNLSTSTNFEEQYNRSKGSMNDLNHDGNQRGNGTWIPHSAAYITDSIRENTTEESQDKLKVTNKKLMHFNNKTNNIHSPSDGKVDRKLHSTRKLVWGGKQDLQRQGKTRIANTSTTNIQEGKHYRQIKDGNQRMVDGDSTDRITYMYSGSTDIGIQKTVVSNSDGGLYKDNANEEGDKDFSKFESSLEDIGGLEDKARLSTVPLGHQLFVDSQFNSSLDENRVTMEHTKSEPDQENILPVAYFTSHQWVKTTKPNVSPHQFSLSFQHSSAISTAWMNHGMQQQNFKHGHKGFNVRSKGKNSLTNQLDHVAVSYIPTDVSLSDSLDNSLGWTMTKSQSKMRSDTSDALATGNLG